MDIKVFSMSLNEMSMNALRNVPEARICSAMSVPPVMIDLPVGMQYSTYNNKREARLMFTENTMMHFWARFGTRLTEGLRDDFGLDNDEWIGFDLSQVVAFKDRLNEDRAWALLALDKGAITRDEARALAGLRPIDGGKHIFLPAQASQPMLPPAKDGAKVLVINGVGRKDGRYLGYGFDEEEVDAAIQVWDSLADDLPGNPLGLLDATVNEVAE